MKKIINNKVYDTDTAKLLGKWGNGEYGNFKRCEEALFQKKTGEFFLYGSGGPMSKYAESAGNNSWTEGSKIIPLTYTAAREWAEEHLTGDEYESIFGEVAEDESRVQICISLPAATAERAKRTAAEQGITVSALIDKLING